MLEGDTRWGDDYFGRSLVSALEREGCTVEQEFWPDWVSEPQDGVVIVLRGLRAWTPPESGFRILWIMSHPTQVTTEELAGYDLVLVASRLHAKILAERTDVPVEVAMQCTDHQLFTPPESSIEQQARTREGVVYVANTRGIRRDMGQFLIETEQPAAVYGRGWGYYSLDDCVRQEHVPNTELPEIYRAARIGLNDHWLDMRALGYVNNRLLDSLACGLPTITDDVPAVRELFGDALLYAGSASEFSEALEYSETHYASLLERVARKWSELGGDYTFARRAAEIVQWIESPPSVVRPKVFDGPVSLVRSVAASLVATVQHEEQRTGFLERERKFLERERKKLSRQLEESKSELSAAAGEARLTEERLAKTQEQLCAATASGEQATQERARAVEGQRVAEMRLREREDAVVELNARCDTLREQCDSVQEERDTLARELQDAKQQVEKWMDSAASWETAAREVDEVRSLLADCEALQVRTAEVNEQLEAALNEREQELAQLHSANDKPAIEKQKAKRLFAHGQSAASHWEATARESAELRAKVDRLEVFREQERAKADDCCKRLFDAYTARDAAVAERDRTTYGLEGLQKECDERQRALASTETELEHYKEQASQLQGEVQQLKHRLKRADDAKANALQKRQLAEIQLESAQVRSEIDSESLTELAAYSERLERKLESMLRSTSWRVTGVMRAAKIGVYSATGKNRPKPVRLAELPQRPVAANAVGDRAKPGVTTSAQTSKNRAQPEDLADYWRAQAHALLQELEVISLRCTKNEGHAQDGTQKPEPVAWYPPIGE